MKYYEAVAILDPQKVEGNGDAFSDAMQAAMKELGASIERVKFFEVRPFTRPIKKHKTGIYWDYVVKAEGDFVAALKDKYRLNPTVLRLVVFDYNAEDNHDKDVFEPSAGHEAMIKEDNFQDAFEAEERSYRGSRN